MGQFNTVINMKFLDFDHCTVLNKVKYLESGGKNCFSKIAGIFSNIFCNFKVLLFTFRPLVHLRLTFVYDVGWRFIFYYTVIRINKPSYCYFFFSSPLDQINKRKKKSNSFQYYFFQCELLLFSPQSGI